MIRLRIIKAIFKKDLEEAVKSKTVLVALLMPLFISAIFSFLGTPETVKHPSIALLGGDNLGLAKFLKASPLFAIKEVKSKEEAFKALYREEVGGIVILPKDLDTLNLANNPSSSKVSLLLDKSQQMSSIIIPARLKEALEIYTGQKLPIKIEVSYIREVTSGQAMLPTWMTVGIIMIGLLIISGNLAEEKDRKTLTAIQVSPAKMSEVILGKGIFGVVLIFATALLLAILNQGLVGNIPLLIIIIFLGSVGFTTIGLLIGIIAKSQASARSLGSILYFPLLIPAVLAEVSNLMNIVAHFLPSFYLLRGLSRAAFMDAGLDKLWLEVIVLLTFDLLSFLACLCFLRRKEE